MASRPGGFLNSAQSRQWDSPKRKFTVHKPNERTHPQRSKSAIDIRPSEFLNSSQNDSFSKIGHTSFSSVNSLNNSTSSFSSSKRDRTEIDVGHNSCTSVNSLNSSGSPVASPKHDTPRIHDNNGGMNNSLSSLSSLQNEETLETSSRRRERQRPARRKVPKRAKSAQEALTGTYVEDYSSIRSCLKNVTKKPKQTMASKVRVISLRSVQSEESESEESVQLVQESTGSHDNELVMEAPSESDKVRAATLIQSVVRMICAKPHLRFLQLQKRLLGMEALTKNDIQRVKADLDKKKKTLKEKAHAKIEARKNKGVLMEETQKSISYLKEDNTNIRKRNAKIEVNMRNLQTNNIRLMKNNEASEDYHHRLRLHHERLENGNRTLQKRLDKLVKEVEELEDELIDKNRVSRMEHAIRCRYQETIDSISKRVRKSKHSNLKKEVKDQIAKLDIQKESWGPMSPKKSRSAFEVERFEPPSLSDNEEDGGSSMPKSPLNDSSSSDSSASSSSSKAKRRKQKKNKSAVKTKTNRAGKKAGKESRRYNTEESSSDSSTSSDPDTGRRSKAAKKQSLRKQKLRVQKSRGYDSDSSSNTSSS